MSALPHRLADTQIAEGRAGFTPGPWIAEVHELSEGPSGIVYDRNGYRVGTDHLTPADAHLIAAAPELYEALRMCLLNGNLDEQERCMGEAALRKARGAK